MKPLAIIPTYLTAGPGLQVLFTCLESLRKTAGDDLDVLIVDDCSPDQDLVAALRSRSDELGFDLIRRPENGGFSRTVNPGLARALEEGRDAVLVNADIEFLDSGWLQLAQNARTDDGRVGSVVGARLIFPNGTLQHGGILFSHLHRVFEHRYRYAPHDLPEALVACEAPVTGALQFIRHDCLAEVGLYDERFCSPADEPVLTANDGYVPIAELDSHHRLVTVNHKAGGRIIRNGGRWHAAGFPFERGVRHYDGQLLAVHGGAACARITPGHKLRVRWTEAALAGHGVYLMRKGLNWRIGTAAMTVSRARARFGPRIRQHMEGADDLWLLEVCADQREAQTVEAGLSYDYGVPQTVFCANPEGNRKVPVWGGQAALDAWWAERRSEPGARAILARYGQHARYPLLSRGPGHYMGGRYHGFLTHASNVMSGLMTVGRDPGQGKQMERVVAHVERAHFAGDVFSLDVPPHHYYVSNGLVVHNSMGWEDVDFCIRTWQAGRACIYEPAIRAIHHESFFRGEQTEKLQRWTAESWFAFCDKYRDQSFAAFVPSVA